MDKPKITPKDFFLWFAAMIFLYVSVFAFISLIFSYLNYAFPDTLSYYSGDPYSSGISYEMATLIVLFPLFLVLMRVIHKNIEADPTRRDIWIRRWALYLVLFVAGVTVAADLITLIMYFFNGDVSMRFGLKVLIILLVAGAGFVHFLADLRDYWQRNPAKARLVGYATAVLVIITILAGFLIVGTPWQARLYRFDEQKVSDLQTIQGQLLSNWQAKQNLPATLAELTDSISGFKAPNDPQTGAPYEYTKKGAAVFELCANFNAPTQPGSSGGVRSYPVGPALTYPAGNGISDNWQHGGGRVCFDRTIDPKLYPPYPTKAGL